MKLSLTSLIKTAFDFLTASSSITPCSLIAAHVFPIGDISNITDLTILLLLVYFVNSIKHETPFFCNMSE